MNVPCEWQGMTARAKTLPRLAKAALLPAALMLSACLSNNVETLAPNMVRLNFAGASDPSTYDAFQALMQLAAQETLARDYQLFRLMDWTMGEAPLNLSAQGARVNFSVVVKMFREGEQGSEPVFDAKNIIKQPEQ